MTWLTPGLALAAAAVAVPALVILYFLKLRRRDVEISTTLLWKKAIEDLQANAPFQRLRRNILLLLQLLALGAVLAALGQPQFQGAAPVGSRHIILLDRSASMSAVDGDPDAIGMRDQATRLEMGKRAAVELVESMREPGLFDRTAGARADEAMVIAFDVTAEVRQTFTSDKAALKAAIEGVTPTDAPSAVEEAFRLAKAHAPTLSFTDETTGQTFELQGRTAGPPATIHLFSDGRLPDAERALAGPEDTVLYHALGRAEAPNVAITSLRAERAFEDPSRLSIFVGLQNTDRAPRAVDVEMRLDDGTALIRPVRLDGAGMPGAAPAAGAGDGAAAPGAPTGEVVPATGGVVFTLERGEGTVVRVAVTSGDGAGGAAPDVLPADDIAWLVVPPAKRLAVALVTREPVYEAALGVLPLSRLERYTPEEFRAAQAAGQAGGFDVIVLDGWLPAPPGGAGPALPPGRYLIFHAVPGGDSGLLDAGAGEETLFVSWDRQHPALRGVPLGDVRFARTKRIELAEDSPARVLAQTDQGPGIVEYVSGEVRAIVVGPDAVYSNWPFQPGFVAFLALATQHLGEEGVGGAGRMLQPGRVLTDRLPVGASDVRVTLPDGTSERLSPTADGRVVFGPVRASGVYELSWSGPVSPADARRGERGVRLVAANLLDPRESDPGTRASVSLAAQVVSGETGWTGDVTRRLWPWLLLAALLVILLEWWVYNRKVHL